MMPRRHSGCELLNERSKRHPASNVLRQDKEAVFIPFTNRDIALSDAVALH
jgi:hypothetical protein